MSNKEKDYSEKTFQNDFVKEMTKYKWEASDYLNGNIQQVTVGDLINNWRKELNRINADQLEGVPLTDGEFSQVLSKVNQISNSFEAAKILAIEESKGKIDGIYRDPNPKITRKQITLTIFKKAEVRGGDSSYKIAREVVSSKGNRFDMILLINGLPLVNIEQKRTDKDLKEAFGQFKRYYEDGEYVNNFMAFSQMMVITSEVATRYFATPKSKDAFNMSFVFGWADENNRPINDWREVIKYFLMIPMTHQMVGDYLVIEDGVDEENKKHMLMRPYQVYALQAVEKAAFGYNNDGIPFGGFVWHTTGSGKTITSFKTALFLSTRVGFDKVIFLVDRRELDRKTSENFMAYANYESVSVDETRTTHELKMKFKSPQAGIIVTTTFKLHSMVTEMFENQDYSLTDKKYVFIIDEAHRTTMGDMMVSIRKYFKQNSLFYGFTGTPLFDENRAKGKFNEKSEHINTTEKLFGPLLHEYTIDEAISDGNVLGFHVDYINTGEFKSYEDLREQLVERLLEQRPELGELEIERMVSSWNETEVEKRAFKERLIVYYDETHIPRVVEYILKHWEKQSQGRHFNAILTVAYKDRVIAYYNEFKKQLKENNQKLNVAMTFSFGNENDPDNVSREVIEDMFKDYAEYTGIEFVVGSNFGESAYFEDIVNRTTRGGSGRNPKNIDLVIVADQLLTGYDSKRLNTLYVDRGLELQGLIQAYSRTNRVYNKTKEFGTIVNFQLPRMTEETVIKAVRLYGRGGTSTKAIVDRYEVAVQKLVVQLSNLKTTLPIPSDWQLIKDNKEKKELFIIAFRNAAAQVNTVKQYYDYSWDEETFGMDEHTWMNYVGAYKNLLEKDENGDDTDIPPLVGKTKLVGTQYITAALIISMIGEKSKEVNGKNVIDEETLRIVYEQIQELSDIGSHKEAMLLKEFVDSELITEHISSDISFDKAFEEWLKEKLKTECIEYAERWGVEPELICKALESYSSSEDKPYIDEIIQNLDIERAKDKSAGDQIYHSIKFSNEYPDWLKETKAKFEVK